jgi:hypothetical protein
LFRCKNARSFVASISSREKVEMLAVLAIGWEVKLLQPATSDDGRSHAVARWRNAVATEDVAHCLIG